MIDLNGSILGAQRSSAVYYIDDKPDSISMESTSRLFPPILLLLILLTTGPSLYAQADTGMYQKVTYYQVTKDGLENFLEGVPEWEESHRNKINSGERVAWRIYRVPMSSSGAWYNFVSVEIAPNLNALQSEQRNNVSSLRNEMDHRVKLLYAVHTEIWKTEADVYGEGTPPSRYLNANFMYAYPENLSEYLELEMEIAKPLHQNQTENNRMDGWNFNRLIFPTGTTVAYNFITTDFYSNLEQIEMGITREVIMNVHPDMNVDEFENFADSIRERVWSDLWELIDHVN
jgi:hypothetical protein